MERRWRRGAFLDHAMNSARCGGGQLWSVHSNASPKPAFLAPVGACLRMLVVALVQGRDAARARGARGAEVCAHGRLVLRCRDAGARLEEFERTRCVLERVSIACVESQCEGSGYKQRCEQRSTPHYYRDS